MNNERRKKLSAIVRSVDGVLADLNKVFNEEQDAYDNLPEPLQCSDRGTDISLALDSLGMAVDSLQNAHGHLLDASM